MSQRSRWGQRVEEAWFPLTLGCHSSWGGFQGCSAPKAAARLLALHLLSGSRTLCSEDGSPAPFTSMKLCLEILMCLAASGGKEELLGISKCVIC